MSFWVNGMGVMKAYDYENEAKKLLQNAIESARRDYGLYSDSYVKHIQSAIDALNAKIEPDLSMLQVYSNCEQN